MRAAILTVILLTGCAIGDGRGFATVDGTLTIDLREDEFTTPDGAEGVLTSVEVGLVHLELAGDTVLDDGTEHRSVLIPVVAAWQPLVSSSPAAFGPLEIDRGDYSELSIVLGRIVVTADVGGTIHRIEIAPEGGTRITVPADLPANLRRLPLVTITAALTLPKDLMDGVELDSDTVSAQLSAAISARSLVDANWVRRSD